MPLAPPPDRVLYPSWDACLSAVQAHAAREGYAVNAKGQTKARDTGLYRRFGIRCDKSGKFKPTSEVRVRRSSTKKTDCPFAAAAIVEPEGCYFSVMVQHHNHPPALAAAYTQHRKLTPEQRQFVEDAMAHERTIRQIWDDFKVRYPYSLVTHKDMDNAVQRFRKKVKQGATGVQAMMYKLVERQDLFCFTLEKGGTLQGAFWVPRWSTEPWMRANGTPDILVMLTENIENRPILPILEMNSLLNSAGVLASQPKTKAQPNGPSPLNATPTPGITPSPGGGNMGSNSSNGAAGSAGGPAANSVYATPNAPSAPGAPGVPYTQNPSSAPGVPHAQNTPNAPGVPYAQNAPGAPNTPRAPNETHPQNTPNGIGSSSSNGLDASLGAGYAILPDKSDSTILWLRSAIEKLRGHIPYCPRPRFLTLTDFHTGEKNILMDVSKGGYQHRAVHIMFGRVLPNDDELAGNHGVRTRRPRAPDGTGRRKRNRANATNTTQSQEGGGEANGEDEEQMDEDGEPQDEDEGEEGGEGEEEDDDDDDDDDDEEEEDDDMDGDNDSDAEIARQLTAGNPHGGVNYRPMAHPQSPRHTAHPHGQNAMSATGPVQQQGRLPLPGHPSMQAQQQPSTYNPAIGGIPGRAMAGHQHQHRPM